LLRVRSRGKVRALNLDERSLIGILGRKIKRPFFPAGDGKRLLAQPFNDPVSKGKGLRTTHTYRGGGLGGRDQLRCQVDVLNHAKARIYALYRCESRSTHQRITRASTRTIAKAKLGSSGISLIPASKSLRKDTSHLLVQWWTASAPI
jgi:hypothetical protein